MNQSNQPLSALDGVTQITVDNADAVLSQLLQCTADVVDLSAIEHCDSAGVAALLEAKAVFSQQQRALIFAHPAQQLHDLATFLKVSDLLFH